MEIDNKKQEKLLEASREMYLNTIDEIEKTMKNKKNKDGSAKYTDKQVKDWVDLVKLAYTDTSIKTKLPLISNIQEETVKPENKLKSTIDEWKDKNKELVAIMEDMEKNSDKILRKSNFTVHFRSLPPSLVHGFAKHDDTILLSVYEREDFSVQKFVMDCIACKSNGMFPLEVKYYTNDLFACRTEKYGKCRVEHAQSEPLSMDSDGLQTTLIKITFQDYGISTDKK